MKAFHRFYRAHFLLPPFGLWSRRNHRSVFTALPVGALDGTILEVGCGDGRLSRLLAARYPGAQIVAIDNDLAMLEVARGGPSLPNLEYRFQDFDEAGSTHALVVAAGVWEFFDLSWSARRAAEVLKPGGVLVVNTVGPASFARLHARAYRTIYRRDVRPHRPEDLCRALERENLSVRWEAVNPLEGSYTLVARKPPGTAAGSP